MRGIVALAGTLGAGVLAGLVARRELTNRVAGQLPGSAVDLATLRGVLDVGEGLWRGPAPTDAGYTELAAAGCSLIVDLRSEIDAPTVTARAHAAGLEVLLLPTDNTRPPAPDHVDQLRRALVTSSGSVYVHCQAGEGRTGALVGAYEVAEGRASSAAVADGLAVGSLTFAQLIYVATAGKAGPLAKAVDLLVDRPTEALIHAVSAAR